MDCNEKSSVRGYCISHYEKHRVNGDLKVRKYVKTDGKCSICDEKHYANGYCCKHRYLFKKYGDPNHSYNNNMTCVFEGCNKQHRTRVAFCEDHLKNKESILKEKHLCKCGCGKQKPKYDIRGRLRPFINNHQRFGRTHTEETKQKIRYKIKDKKSTYFSKPERKLNSILNLNGIKCIRFKSFKIGKTYHQADIFIEPNIIIEEDGCYYHWCKECHTEPPTHPRIIHNIKRDKLINETLKNQGYKIIRIKEHDINKDIMSCLEHIRGEIS